MKYQVLSLLLLFVLCSCGSDTATSSANTTATEDTVGGFSAAEIAAQTKAYESMMDLHDRVMPKMGNIAQMQKMLKDAMDKEKTPKPEFEAAYNELENAYDGMMNWMKGMKSMDELRELGDQTKIMEYVKEEAVSMGKIEKMLESGLTTSYKLLGVDPAEMNAEDHSGHDHEGHNHSNHEH